MKKYKMIQLSNRLAPNKKPNYSSTTHVNNRVPQSPSFTGKSVSPTLLVNLKKKCNEIIARTYTSIGKPLINIDGVLPKENVITTMDIKLKAKREFFKNFLGNNPETENVLRNANFDVFAKKGLPLKYKRKEFIKDINKIVKNLNLDEKTNLFKQLEMRAKLNWHGEFVSYEGIPTTKHLDAKNELHNEILQVIEKFTLKNEVISDDKALNKAMNAMLAGVPEHVHSIGKKQHQTQRYTVDIHILKVLQEALNHPDYKRLQDKGKTILKLKILFHDMSKQEGLIDKTHQKVSALYARDILKRFNAPKEFKDRIYILIKNHHWLEGFNKGTSTPEEVAAIFRNPQDYLIAKIFAHADLKGIGRDFFERFGEALSSQRQAPVQKALNDRFYAVNNLILADG